MRRVKVQAKADPLDDLGKARRGRIFRIFGEVERLHLVKHLGEAAHGKALAHGHSSDQHHEPVDAGNNGRVLRDHAGGPGPESYAILQRTACRRERGTSAQRMPRHPRIPYRGRESGRARTAA